MWYLPAEETALALGWTPLEEGGFALGERQVVFAAGQPCLVNGTALRLSAPALELNGRLYLPLSVLCSALGLELEAAWDQYLLSPRP